MLDLHANLVFVIALNGPISMGFLVDDVDVNGRALFTQTFLLEEEAEQRRAKSDAIVCRVDNNVKPFFRNNFIVPPAVPEVGQVLLDFRMR